MAHAAAPIAHPTNTVRLPSWVIWLGFVVLCNATGILSSLFAGEPSVYRVLVRPSWAPPPVVFGPVWTILYTMMGTATWLMWTRGKDRAPALAIFGVQLATNFAWTPIFFGLHAYGVAAIVLGLNWVAVLAMAIAYGRRYRPAGYLILPLLAWVSFAGALNVAIWWLNR